ncbi:MAG TPA: hypothetical protein VJM53_02420 [Burkholderiales bacterium]|nr:hypothetical protein [Burkholderiales bacterium]
MESTKPRGRLRLIEGDRSLRLTECKYLLARGRLMQAFYQGHLLVHGGLSIHAAYSFDHFLDLLEKSHYDGLLIDVEWEGGVNDAVHLLQTVRAIESYTGQKSRPVVICTTKAAGWRADAIDENLRVYELERATGEGLPQDFVDFLWTAVSATDHTTRRI